MTFYDDPDWYDEDDLKRWSIRRTLLISSPHLSEEERMEVENDTMREIANAKQYQAMLDDGFTPNVQLFDGAVVYEEDY